MKKILLTALLSLATTFAYADGSVNVKVTGDLPQTQWNLNGKDIISYQFNDKANRVMLFTVTVDSQATNPLAIYCWSKHEIPPRTVEVQPGTTFRCASNDTVKMSALPSQVLAGHYSITLVNQ